MTNNRAATIVPIVNNLELVIENPDLEYLKKAVTNTNTTNTYEQIR